MATNDFIQGLVKKAKAAQREFEGFSQERIDKVCKALGLSIYESAEELAKEAVAETGMGDVESKIRKQRVVTMSHWDYIKDKKSVGVIDDDPESLVTNYAKPIGVIACITPTTNPTSTVAGNGMYALKARNAVIVAPHPRAKRVTAHGVLIAREAIEKAGAPADLLQVLEEPTIELTQALMAACDQTIATGGPGMVKAAYSSGRPSLGVGQGNCQTIIDRGCQDLYEAYAEGTIRCRTVDCGVQCNGEQTIHLPKEEKDAIISAFVKFGGFLIEDEKVLDVIRTALFDPKTGAINTKLVGQSPQNLGKVFGIEVPAGIKVLVVKGKGTAQADPLCREKLCPILTYLPYEKFEDGVENGLQNLLKEGAGHSSVVFTHDPAHIDLVARTWPVCRVTVNFANTMAGGNTPLVGWPATMSLGCGSWGNNSVPGNTTFKHMMNITSVARVIPGKVFYDPAIVWA